MIAAFNIVIGLIVVNAPNRQSLEYDRKRKCDFVNIISFIMYGIRIRGKRGNGIYLGQHCC